VVEESKYSTKFLVHSLPGSDGGISCFSYSGVSFAQLGSELDWDHRKVSFRELINAVISFCQEILGNQQVYACVPSKESNHEIMRSLIRLGFEESPPSVCFIDGYRIFSFEIEI